MSGSFRTCPHCQRLTLNQRCDNPACTGPGARTTTPEHAPVVDSRGRVVCICGDFYCASLVDLCAAAYGKNPDRCNQPADHKKPHSNRWGTTWAWQGSA